MMAMFLWPAIGAEAPAFQRPISPSATAHPHHKRWPKQSLNILKGSLKNNIEYLRRGDESQALPSLWLFFFPF